MSLGDQTICRGNLQSTFVLQTTLTPGSVAATTAAEQTFTVPGLLPGDQVSDVGYQGAWTVAVAVTNWRVTATGLLGVSYYNGTAGGLTPPAGTYLIEINRPDGTPLVGVIQ